MLILISGSRTFTDYKLLERVLNKLTSKLKDKAKELIIMHGGAKGADSLASQWCDRNLVTYKIYRPDYERYKNNPKKAPIMRNQEMVEVPDINLVVAFWNGVSSGTKDLIQRAQQEDLYVKIVLFGERTDK